MSFKWAHFKSFEFEVGCSETDVSVEGATSNSFEFEMSPFSKSFEFEVGCSGRL